MHEVGDRRSAQAERGSIAAAIHDRFANALDRDEYFAGGYMSNSCRVDVGRRLGR